MNAIYFLLQIFLSLLLYYASFVSIYISFIKNKQYDFLTVFFVLTLFSFSSFSIYRIYQLIKNNLSGQSFSDKVGQNTNFFIKKVFKQRKSFLPILGLSLISLLIGFFNVYTQYPRGVTVSEMGQFGSSLNQNIVEASINQQQPPLDYYFSSFSHNLFGESKFAVRFHAMFFYLILSFILSFGLYFLCSSVWITSIGSSLFLVNHVIRLHSVEGRPLCLALLTGFLFLFFYLSYCKKNSSDKQSLFPILASQYLFAISIGLQPIIFIGSLFLSSFWLLCNNKKDAFKKLFLSNMAAGILTLPFYIKLWDFGQSAYKFKKISIESINSYIKNLDVFYFLEKYFFSFYEQMFLFFWLVVIGLILIIFIKKHINTQMFMISLSLILFPLLYDFIFHIIISWFDLSFHKWYFILQSLFLIVFIVLALKKIHLCLKITWMKKLFFSLVFVLFTGNMYFQILAIKTETQFHYPYRDNSVEEVYNYLKKRGSPKDIAIEFSLTPILSFRAENITFEKILFYNPHAHPIIYSYFLEFTKTPPFFFERSADSIYYINQQSFLKKSNQKIFFIVGLENQNSDKAYNILSSFIKEGVKIGRFNIFELTLSSENKKKEFLLFLTKINKKTPKKYQGALYETLIYYAYKNGNKKEFSRLLEEYRNIEMSLDKFTPDFKYPSRFELRRRVQYFENLEWNLIN